MPESQVWMRNPEKTKAWSLRTCWGVDVVDARARAEKLLNQDYAQGDLSADRTEVLVIQIDPVTRAPIKVATFEAEVHIRLVPK